MIRETIHNRLCAFQIMGSTIETHFAPAARASQAELEAQIEAVNESPIVGELLAAVGGLLAVLNENRQILSVNQSLLDTLGLSDSEQALGLRPGEALHCVRAHVTPGGCGTSQACASCGAVIAMVTSLAKDEPVEQTCALETTLQGKKRDLYFRVRACPIELERQRFLLLFLQDISKQQNLAVLERSFFHDVNNLLNGAILGIESLEGEVSGDAAQIAGSLRQRLWRLSQEVKIQQQLAKVDETEFRLQFTDVSVRALLDELRRLYGEHPAARQKKMLFACPEGEPRFKADLTLLLRVLGNMLLNALEASVSGDEVRVSCPRCDGDFVQFEVWNRQVIPPEVASRIFQLNFTTKGTMGRGLGTFSMKLLGEQHLGGKVSFNSSLEQGTIFRFELPWRETHRKVTCEG